MVENDRYCISEETIDKIREYLLSIGVQENHRDYILGRLRSRLYDPVAERKVTPKYGEYQCSWCKRNKFNGDESCPLALDLDISNENSDILNGVNRVIKSCGCGSFIDTRSHPAPAPSAEKEYIITEKMFLQYLDIILTDFPTLATEDDTSKARDAIYLTKYIIQKYRRNQHQGESIEPDAEQRVRDVISFMNNCNCDTCKYFPAGSIYDEECPQSMPLSFNWDVPIDIWQEITRQIGCVHHSSIKKNPSRTDKLMNYLKKRADAHSKKDAIALLKGEQAGEGR